MRGQVSSNSVYLRLLVVMFVASCLLTSIVLFLPSTAEASVFCSSYVFIGTSNKWCPMPCGALAGVDYGSWKNNYRQTCRDDRTGAIWYNYYQTSANGCYCSLR